MSYTRLEDVGHRLLVEPSSTSLTGDEKDILAELRPSSFIFRARNFDFKAPYDEWFEKFVDLIDQIRAVTGRSQLVLSIDHEGGGVVRPPHPITRFPYAAAWGDKVAEVSQAMALELRSLGLNTTWAPVADVLTNLKSKAIGRRAFASDPATVTEKALLMANTLEANGIAAGAKHFPGYGAVVEDAHYDLPTAAISLQEWQEVHFPPFVSLIKAGVRFVMTAHLMCPELDTENQATLSQKILSDLLRGKLSFKGVVVADALGMGAIRSEIEQSSTIEKAINADLDLFCVAGDSVDLNTAANIARQILGLVQQGRVQEERLDQSRQRIDSALETLQQHSPERLDDAVFKGHQNLAHDLDPNDEWSNFQYIPKGFD